MRQSWRLAIGSALLYTLAFNLTFFIQELFLVVPKALTPGLRPTLFHNNHKWEGAIRSRVSFRGPARWRSSSAPLSACCSCAAVASRSTTIRLFLVWMAFSGFFQALPQVVMGAFVPGNDVGMAMDYFHMTPARQVDVAAFGALAAMIPIGTTPGSRDAADSSHR